VWLSGELAAIALSPVHANAEATIRDGGDAAFAPFEPLDGLSQGFLIVTAWMLSRRVHSRRSAIPGLMWRKDGFLGCCGAAKLTSHSGTVTNIRALKST
jgi:hypothetical protein